MIVWYEINSKGWIEWISLGHAMIHEVNFGAEQSKDSYVIASNITSPAGSEIISLSVVSHSLIIISKSQSVEKV